MQVPGRLHSAPMSRLGSNLTQMSRSLLVALRSKDSFFSGTFALVATVVLFLWLTVVIVATTRHEFWRDEVRALSLARAASSPLDLYGLTQYDGHPILWFLLLHIGVSIADTSVVLPATSILVAFAAVALFILFSPFPLWVRCLFIFSALPVYEYSVMARNYGISMLLLFVVALLYRNRARHPLALASSLALLANTNVHSALFAYMIAALWIWDSVIDQRRSLARGRPLSLCLPLAIVFAGVFLCAAFTMPRENTILTPIRHSLNIRDLAYAFLDAVLRPEASFPKILPAGLPRAVRAPLLYCAVLGLAYRRDLLVAAFSCQTLLGVFFRIVYLGDYRHQGLFLVFLLFLYWLFIDSSPDRGMSRPMGLLFFLGFYIALLGLILGNVAKDRSTLWRDIRLPKSSSRALGEFLNHSAIYRDAIIVPEPDYYLESLPYYANNKIYLSREHRFATFVSWTTVSDSQLSLGELISVARSVKSSHGRPVLILLGHREIDKAESGTKRYYGGKVFSWEARDLAALREETALIRDFNFAYGDENYRVYAVR